MELLLKLAAPVGLLLLAILDGLLAYRSQYSDRRTKKHRQARAVRTLLICLLGVLTVGVVLLDHQSAANKEAKIDELGRQLTSQQAENRENEARAVAQREELESRLALLQGQLDPFLALATQRFPESPEESDALEMLAAELESLTQRTTVLEETNREESTRRTYVPPSRALRENVVSQLRELLSRTPALSVHVYFESGNPDRARVAGDLFAMIQEAGVSATRSSSYTLSLGPVVGVEAVYHPNDEGLLQDFAHALSGYLGGTLSKQREPHRERYHLELKLRGDVRFHENTGVEFP